MRDIIHMVVVLALLGAASGGGLALVKQGTAAQIELQQLTFVKGPAINAIMKGCSNNPITDRFKIQDGDVERSFYVGVFDGKPKVVAYETYGKGFGGDIGIMVGVNLDTDQLVGMGVTTPFSETPGLGARAKTEKSFINSFKGLSIKEPVKIKSEGGGVDAISGASITSKGICAAITDSEQSYERLKPQIVEKAAAFAK